MSPLSECDFTYLIFIFCFPYNGTALIILIWFKRLEERPFQWLLSLLCDLEDTRCAYWFLRRIVELTSVYGQYDHLTVRSRSSLQLYVTGSNIDRSSAYHFWRLFISYTLHHLNKMKRFKKICGELDMSENCWPYSPKFIGPILPESVKYDVMAT